MDDLVFIYGVTDLIERGMMLTKYFVPKKGKLYYDIIHRYFVSVK